MSSVVGILVIGKLYGSVCHDHIVIGMPKEAFLKTN